MLTPAGRGGPGPAARRTSIRTSLVTLTTAAIMAALIALALAAMSGPSSSGAADDQRAGSAGEQAEAAARRAPSPPTFGFADETEHHLLSMADARDIGASVARITIPWAYCDYANLDEVYGHFYASGIRPVLHPLPHPAGRISARHLAAARDPRCTCRGPATVGPAAGAPTAERHGLPPFVVHRTGGVLGAAVPVREDSAPQRAQSAGVRLLLGREDGRGRHRDRARGPRGRAERQAHRPVALAGQGPRLRLHARGLRAAAPGSRLRRCGDEHLPRAREEARVPAREEELAHRGGIGTQRVGHRDPRPVSTRRGAGAATPSSRPFRT